MREDIAQLNKDRISLLEFYQEVYPRLTDMIEKVRAGGTYIDSELADLGWICREIEDMADDLRKEAKFKKELMGKIIALKQTKKAMADPSQAENISIRGELALATPRISAKAKIPARDTKEYLELCEHLGIPTEVAVRNYVRLSFTNISDYLTDLMEKGKPIPPGLKDMPNYYCMYRSNENKRDNI